MNRTTLLASLAAIPAFALPAAARTNSAVRIALAPIDNNALPFFAQSEGFFTKSGLNVSIAPMQSGAAMSAAVAGGSIDIASSNIVQLAQAHERKIPFTILAGAGLYVKGAPTTVLMVPNTSVLRNAKDFSGKTIAVTGLKSISQFAPMAWADQNGGDSSQIRFIEMPLQDMIGAMTQGRVDGAVVLEPFISEAKSASCRVFADVFGAIGSLYLISAYFSTVDWAKANPDAVARFQNVMRQTAVWANTHHRESADILVRDVKLNPAVMASLTRAVFADHLDVRLIQPVIDVSAKYGGLSSFPAEELIFHS